MSATAYPVDAESGCCPHAHSVTPSTEIIYFKPSDRGDLTLKIVNASSTPIGIKGVWLADFCQSILRDHQISQRKINQSTIQIYWVRGSCDPAGDGFVRGQHKENSQFYHHHDIALSTGGEDGEGNQIYFSLLNILKTLTHEMIHAVQHMSGRLHYTWFNDSCRFTFKAPNGTKQTGWVQGENKVHTGYEDLGYEMEAWGMTTTVFNRCARKNPDQEVLGYDPESQCLKMEQKEIDADQAWFRFQMQIGDTSGWY